MGKFADGNPIFLFDLGWISYYTSSSCLSRLNNSCSTDSTTVSLSEG